VVTVLAIVCSGGGNRGASQAGALEVLLDAGVVPDLLVGASVGAVNAAYLAADPSPAQARRLVEVWRQLRSRDVFPLAPTSVALSLVRGSDHVCSAEGLRSLLEHHLPYRRLEDAAVPLIVVATDLITGTERRLRDGPVVPAVLASAAIPAVFPPVRWGEELLVDGGVVANVPLRAAIDAGADEVWILDSGELCEERRPPHSAVDVALQALAVLSTARARAELACLPPGVAVHHVVLPCTTHRWYTDFSGSAELAADGAAAARAALATRAMEQDPAAADGGSRRAHQPRPQAPAEADRDGSGQAARRGPRSRPRLVTRSSASCDQTGRGEDPGLGR
jgi:NTE family protein